MKPAVFLCLALYLALIAGAVWLLFPLGSSHFWTELSKTSLIRVNLNAAH
jgi:hypothetical protein